MPISFPQSIKTHLFLITFIVAFPAMCIILYSGFQYRQSALDHALRNTQKLADRIVTEQQILVNGAEQLMTALAQLPDVKKHDSARVEPVLRKLLALNPMYSNIFIANLNGNVWATAIPTKPPFIVADRRYFRNAISSGRLASGEYVISRATSKATFNLAYPMKDEHGNVTNVISVGFILDKYRYLLKQMNLPNGTSFVLCDHKGIVMSRAIDPEKFIGKPYPSDSFRQMLENKDDFTTIRTGIAGDRRIITLRKLFLPGEQEPYMYITAGIPVNVALHEANQSILKNMMSLFIFMGLALALAWFVAKRSITDRIALLKDASQRLANGEHKTGVSKLLSGGELGDLCQTFDQMAQKIALREQELVSSQRNYQEIFNATKDSIFVHDMNTGKILETNKAVEEMFGYSCEEILTLTINDLSLGEPPYSMNEAIQWIEKSIKQGPQTFEWISKRRNGECFYAEIVLSSSNLGGEGRVLAVVRDINERKKAEIDRENLKEQLIQVQKLESIGRLAGGIAHDFNNLLTPIIGYTSLLKLNMKPDSLESQKANSILEAADKARILTQQLLSYGRKQILEMKVVDVNEVISSFYEILRRTIREDIEIQLHLSYNEYSIKADRNQLEQIIMNLTINAQDAIKDKGIIKIETLPVSLDDEYIKEYPVVKTGRYLMLVVTDSGCGMDPETLENIFEPFFTTKGVGKGTGLGLATVYGLVKEHGGYIWAFSEIGKGTVFKLYFPIVDEKPVSDTTALSNGMFLETGSRTILLVEDNEMVRNLVYDMLIKLGFTVLVSDNPNKALEMSEGQYIDLLLTDVIMPEMNGPELFKRLSEVHGRLKVLYMSGYTNNIICHHGVLDEGINFIQKPFAINDLAKKVEVILNAPLGK